jgi:hypothetical protein
MSEKLTTDMAAERLMVKFKRTCRVKRGSTDAVFGAGDHASFPAETARRLIDAGDAVADGEHPPIVRKCLT